MNSTECHAFEKWCQQRFDDRLPLAPLDDSPGVAAHVASCAHCQAIVSRYGRLDTVIDRWSGSIASPPGLADRIVNAALNDRRPFSFVALHGRALLAAAALLLIALGLGVRHSLNARRAGEIPVATATTAPPPPLQDAFAAATTATLDLARRTSEPATRVGSRVIARAKFPASPELSLSVPIRPASDMISALGDDVNRGVKPLSGSARSAFGFLLAPWPRDDKGGAAERAGQGA